MATTSMIKISSV